MATTLVTGLDSTGTQQPVHVDGQGNLLVADSSMGGEGFTNLSQGFPKQVLVGPQASVILFNANAQAIYRHIANNTIYPIWIQYSSQAAPYQGILIPPRSIAFFSGANLFLGTINAIGPVANQSIDVLEGET